MPKEEKKEDKEEEEEEEAHPMMKMMAASLKPAAMFSRGIADYVFAADQPLYHHFPVIDFTLKEKDGKLVVTRIRKKSFAEKSGIRKEDQITAVDGVRVTTLEQLRLLITKKNWDDSVTFGVVKKIELKKE